MWTNVWLWGDFTKLCSLSEFVGCVVSFSLQTLAPAVQWMPYLTEVFAPVPLNESEPVVVYAKEYLQKVSDLIIKTNKRSDQYFPWMCELQLVCIYGHVCLKMQ